MGCHAGSASRAGAASDVPCRGRCAGELRRSDLNYDERLVANLPKVRARISAAEHHAGRGPGSVRLVAVTKAHGDEAVEAALRAGLYHLGENRVEELEGKRLRFREGRVVWHLIGHVQSRKARRAAACADIIHSIDSPGLARKVGAAAAERGAALTVLVQVNVSGERSKSGLRRSEALDGVLEISETDGLDVTGLMTMAPFGADASTLSRTFGGLRLVSERARALSARVGPELSMGMTEDMEVAIAEGSTMVRVGTALFGPRPGPRAG